MEIESGHVVLSGIEAATSLLYYIFLSHIL